MVDSQRTACVPHAFHGKRLDRAAVALLGPEYSRTRLQRWIREGRLLVEGEVVADPGRPVEEGWRLVLRPPRPEVPADGSPLAPRILHEDAALAVLDKPSGLPMHGNSPGDPQASVAHWLVARWGAGLPIAQGAERPGIVHRLDRDTSGVCVVARDKAAFEDLMAQFAERSVEKEYLALCYGRPRFRSDWVDLRLAPDPRRPNRQRTTRSTEAGSRDALTYWEVAEEFDGFSLLRVLPRTGRRHQIRAHLAAVDLPLVGDPLYRARNFGPGMLPAAAAPPARTFLHAAALTFEHPVEGGRRRFAAEPPDDFRALLEVLRRERPLPG